MVDLAAHIATLQAVANQEAEFIVETTTTAPDSPTLPSVTEY